MKLAQMFIFFAGFVLIILNITHGVDGSRECILGDITHVQSWLLIDGHLNFANPNISVSTSLDLSGIESYRNRIYAFVERYGATLRYLSLANLKLKRISHVLSIPEKNTGIRLSDSIQYLSFYGSNFGQFDDAGRFLDEKRDLWREVFQQNTFPKLKQLDLRRTNIFNIEDNTFAKLKALEYLFMGGNHITKLSADSFTGLNNLLHLDLAHNVRKDAPVLNQGMVIENKTFDKLNKLVSLDISDTRLSPTSPGVFQSLPKTLKRLSLCNTNLQMPLQNFNANKLKILDISGNLGILANSTWFESLSESLEFLNAGAIGLNNFNVFSDFTKMRGLMLNNNFLVSIKNITLNNLELLDLDDNRMISWLSPKFTTLRRLKFLSLRNNNLNIVYDLMVEDLKRIKFIGLSKNPFVCSCNIHRLLRKYLICTERGNLLSNDQNNTLIRDPIIDFHTMYFFYHQQIKDFGDNGVRLEDVREVDDGMMVDGNCQPTLYDYRRFDYVCTDFYKELVRYFYQIEDCSDRPRNLDIVQVVQKNHYYVLAAALVVTTLLIIATVIAWKWWYIRYFFILLRNAATMSLIGNEQSINEDETMFLYDVFVSYCNEDREWIIQELLPNIESNSNITICLHERDFEVGVTIFDNIVSSMDRSRHIMLIISRQFLLSHWCQFEMHLAQHRLMETRRENLLLILLEDIPRRLRPNTLHYLMMSKTYITWEQGKNPDLFWKRVQTALKRFNKHD